MSTEREPREPYYAPAAEAVEIIFEYHHANALGEERIRYDVNFTTDIEPLFAVGDMVYLFGIVEEDHTKTTTHSFEEEADGDEAADDEVEGDDDDGPADDDKAEDDDEDNEDEAWEDDDNEVENDGETADDDEDTEENDESTQDYNKWHVSEHALLHCQAFEILEIRKGDEIGFNLNFKPRPSEIQDDREDHHEFKYKHAGAQGHTNEGIAVRSSLERYHHDDEALDRHKSPSAMLLEESEEDDRLVRETLKMLEEVNKMSRLSRAWYYRLDMSNSVYGPSPRVAWWHEDQLRFAPLAMDDLSEFDDNEEILTDIPTEDDSDSGNENDSDGDMAEVDAATKFDSQSAPAGISSAQTSNVIIIDDDDAEEAVTSPGATLEGVKNGSSTCGGITLPATTQPNYPSLPALEAVERNHENINSVQAETRGVRRPADDSNIEETANPNNAKRRRFWNC